MICWLKSELRGPGELEGVMEVAGEISKNKVVLVTSALTRAEILDCKMEASAISKYNKFIRRSNVAIIPLDHAIAELTSELRSFYNTGDFELLTPDAIHLATAIHMKVDEFHTFDGSDTTRKPKNKSFTKCVHGGSL